MSEEEEKVILEATEKIHSCIAKAEAAIKEAEDLADQHGIIFSWYGMDGMGGQYLPKGSKMFNHEADEPDTREIGEWVSSSSGC